MEDRPTFDSTWAAAFMARFGTDNTDAVMSAAIEHNNGIHNNPGSDIFRWAIAICIGYDCFGSYAARYHGITVAQDEVKRFCLELGGLGTHDGDVDYLGLMSGSYNEWILEDAKYDS